MYAKHPAASTLAPTLAHSVVRRRRCFIVHLSALKPLSWSHCRIDKLVLFFNDKTIDHYHHNSQAF